MVTASPTHEPGPIATCSPMRALRPPTAHGPLLALVATCAEPSTTADAWTPGSGRGGGLRSADTRAKYAYGFAVTMRGKAVASRASGPTTTAPARVAFKCDR